VAANTADPLACPAFISSEQSKLERCNVNSTALSCFSSSEVLQIVAGDSGHPKLKLILKPLAS